MADAPDRTPLNEKRPGKRQAFFVWNGRPFRAKRYLLLNLWSWLISRTAPRSAEVAMAA